MKQGYFYISIVVVMMFSILSQLNTGSPERGFLLGLGIVVMVAIAMIAVGLIESKLVDENNVAVAAAVIIIGVLIIAGPVLLIHGWVGVTMSVGLAIFWKEMVMSRR